MEQNENSRIEWAEAAELEEVRCDIEEFVLVDNNDVVVFWLFRSILGCWSVFIVGVDDDRVLLNWEVLFLDCSQLSFVSYLLDELALAEQLEELRQELHEVDENEELE